MELKNVVNIKIIGVGGGGSNAVNRMVEKKISDVSYVSINTDNSAVERSLADEKIQIGRLAVKGYGAGADPDKGKISAEENSSEIEKSIRDCDMLFITAGMGGGTGTGAAPIVAKIARQLGILTVAVVTKPFSFEGGRRKKQAEDGIKNLEQLVDAMIVIQNDNLKHISNAKIALNNAFAIADDVLMQTVKNIVELIQNTSFINCDFTDLTTILKKSGYVHVARARALGTQKVENCINQLTNNILLNTSIDNATGILLHLVVSGNVSLEDVDKISSYVSERADSECNFIFGLNFDENLEDEISVLLLATHKIL